MVEGGELKEGETILKVEDIDMYKKRSELILFSGSISLRDDVVFSQFSI